MNLNLILQVPQMMADSMNVATTEVAEKVVEMNYWEMATKGGWIMVPLILLFLLSVYITVERIVTIRSASKEDPTFMNRIKDYILEGKVDSAMKLCQQTNSPSARMIEKGVSRLGRPMQDMMVAIENVGNLEISKLEKGVDIGECVTKPATAQRIGENELNLTITEGKFHQIKRMLHAVDNEVIYLKRLSYGDFHLDEALELGEYRLLTATESEYLCNVYKRK